MGLASGNVSVLATWDCVSHEGSWSLCSAGGRRRHGPLHIRAVHCSPVSCHDLCIIVSLLSCYSEKVVNYPKGWFFKCLLNRGRDDSVENGSTQGRADGLCMISILVTFSRCCVVLLCGNNLWHIEEFEHWSLTFMVNYSYSVAVLEETEMHCSSETVVPIWDFECESALLNLSFARSFKVSRFVNIFLPLIFWNKSQFFFFPE